MNVISSINKIIKIIFLSFEAFFALCMIIIYQLKFQIFNDFGNFLYSSNDVITFITVAVPISIFVYSLSLQKILLQPEANNAVLVKWHDYETYKLITIVGLIFCLLPIFPSIISWMYKDVYKVYDIGFYYLFLLGISLISVISLHFAQFRIKEILDSAKDS